MYFGSTDYSDQSANRFALNNTNQADMERVARAGSRVDYGVLGTVAGAAVGGVLDLADTVASSVSSLIPGDVGVKRGDLNSSVMRMIDRPGLTKFFNDNQAGIEAASGIYGIIGAELVTRKFTAPAGLLMKGMAKLPYARRIAALDQQYDNALTAVRMADRELARRGALGVEQYIGRVGLDGSELARAGVAETTRRGLYWKAKGLGFARGATYAAAVEGTMAVTLNQNGFLYDDDMAHNVAWMSLGLLGGGVFDAVAAGYQARKYVNSDEVKRLYANALDPDQTESARLIWKDRVLGGLTKGQMAEAESLGFLGGRITDRVTNLRVGAQTLLKSETGLSEAGQNLASSRSQLATQNLQQVFEEVQKVTTRGLSTNSRETRFSEKTTTGAWNHLQQLVNSDAGAVFGAESISAIPIGKSGSLLHENHITRLDEYIDDLQKQLDEADEAGDTNINYEQVTGMIQRLKYERNLTPVPYIDGEAATLSDLKTLDDWVEPEWRQSKSDADTTLFETISENPKGGVGIDTKLRIYMPGNKTLDKADHFDMLRLYRVADEAVQSMKNTDAVIQLDSKPSWFQLDMAEQLIRESEGRVKVAFPDGLTRETAMVESLAQKAEALQRDSRKGQIKQVVEGRKGREYDPTVEGAKARVKYNLPRLSAYERGLMDESEHPLEQLLRGAAEYDPNEIRKMKLQDVMMGVNSFKRLGDFAPSAPSDFADMLGTSFKYMKDGQGRVTQPLMMYKRAFNGGFDWAPDNLADRLATRKMFTMQRLAEDDQSLTGLLAKALMSSPDMDAASRTHELMETAIQGSVLGSSNQSLVGGITKALKFRDWTARDTPQLLAAARVQEQAQRLTRDMFQREAAVVQDSLQKLNGPRNGTSKLLLNQFIAYRSGWDLQVKKGRDSLLPVQLPNGRTGYKFLLQNTEQNASRWQTMFGEAMPEGAALSSPQGTEVILDDLGLEFMGAFNQLTESLRANKNQLLAANSFSRNIAQVDFYVPPPNIDGKFIGFTMNPEGKVVPGMTVIANTQEQFAREQARVIKEITDKNMNGYVFRTRDEVESFADIWERAQMDMIDPGTTAVQPGKRGRGGLQGLDIDMNGVEGILNTVRSQYFGHTRDVVSTLFRDQINSAKARSTIATDVTRNRAKTEMDQKLRGIHDMYLENLLGTSPLNSKGSVVGKYYNAVEGTVNRFLAEQAPSFSRAWDATTMWFGRANPWSRGEEAKKDFASLSKALGEYMPFESAARMAEARGAGSMPPELADAMGATSRFSAAVMLRILEPAMAVMNLTGMVNAMPSVIRHMGVKDGETVEEFAQRVGHVATIFPDSLPNGQPIATIDMGKIMQRGFKRAWSKESHPDFDFMKRNGYLTQEVAEFQKQFGAIDSKGSLMRFVEKITDWTSVLTDRSEDFSRSWGHMAGLEVADVLGITGLEARNTFAHDMANKMIANYSPHNRPEVFQGALGAPLGLFQSFIFNYYQRLFRYIETKDYRSLATQYAMQGSLFGVSTVPGWSEANQFFFDMSDGETDGLDGIYAKYGQSAGDVIMGGTISNIPKLFGLEGVDLYSRGDTAIRLPGFNLPPAATMAGKIIGGMSAGFKAAFSGNNPDLTGQQMAEIVSNAIPNRPISGVIEQLFAGGYDTDMSGQIASDTKSMTEATYRVLGVKSMRQSKELEAFYANKNANEQALSRNELLRTSTRAAIRGGNMDSLPKIMEQYLENGGDPRYFRRWLKSNYEAATESRAARQLDDVMNNPAKMSQVARLLDAGVGIREADESEDYSQTLHQQSVMDSPQSAMIDYGGSTMIAEGDEFGQ